MQARRGPRCSGGGQGQQAAVKRRQWAAGVIGLGADEAETGAGAGWRRRQGKDANLHKVTLEEFLQLPLGCRVGQVADVQAATFGSAGKDGIVVVGLVALVSEGGVGQSVGDFIDGRAGSVNNFLHDGRHGD